jgi:hypothetical protein
MPRTRLLFTAEAWAGWDLAKTAAADLTDDELDALVEIARAEALARVAARWSGRFRSQEPTTAQVLAVTHDRANTTIEVYLVPDAVLARLGWPPSRRRAPTGFR